MYRLYRVTSGLESFWVVAATGADACAFAGDEFRLVRDETEDFLFDSDKDRADSLRDLLAAEKIGFVGVQGVAASIKDVLAGVNTAKSKWVFIDL